MADKNDLIAEAFDVYRQEMMEFKPVGQTIPLHGDDDTVDGKISKGKQEHKDGDVRFFIKRAWEEIFLAVYTMLRTLLQLFLDVSLCLSYYQNGDTAWFLLTAIIMITSNLVCFIWMLGIQYGSNRFRDIEVLIDEKKRPHLGLMDFIKKTYKTCCCGDDEVDGGNDESAVRTYYHVLPNYRVFFFNDNPEKDFNIHLNPSPSQQSLKFNGALLPFLALINQLPTYLEYKYLKWRYGALASLRKDGHHYHEKMVKCVFVMNILQMVLIVSFGERAFQLFLQLYIVTQANIVSPLQLSQILLGFFGMLFSCVYVQTICSYMVRNLWENGFYAYVGSLCVYITMNLLALIALIVIFITAAIYHHALAFISFGIFLVYLLSFFSRGILIKFRPIIVPIAKILFWILFGIFVYSNYKWHLCMTNFNDFTSMDYKPPSQLLLQSYADANKTFYICPGARIKACNLTALEIQYSGSWAFSEPFICVSVYYDKLYFVIGLIPYVILLFAFMSPLHKGFEFYYDYKPRILPGEPDRATTDDGGMENFYRDVKRGLRCPGVLISVVKTRQKSDDDDDDDERTAVDV